MKGLIPVLLIISVLLVSGCTAPSEPSDTTGGTAGGDTAPVTGDPSSVQGIDAGISGVDDISSDLDISDMDTLETDLGDISW